MLINQQLANNQVKIRRIHRAKMNEGIDLQSDVFHHQGLHCTPSNHNEQVRLIGKAAKCG